MTIEERADKAALRCFPQPSYNKLRFGFRCGYKECATEQREINIQRATEWYCNKCKFAKSCAMRYSQDNCSDIKQLKQAMKGEEK